MIRDPHIKQTVGALYQRAWDEIVAPRYRSGEPAPGTSSERFNRMLSAAEYLAHHIHEAPVWIVSCLQGESPTRTAGSSIYPAVQNTLLAARALGLGATLTTLYLNFENEAEAALGLPSDWYSYALIPIGYPMGRFGPVRRVALGMSCTRTDGGSLTQTGCDRCNSITASGVARGTYSIFHSRRHAARRGSVEAIDGLMGARSRAPALTKVRLAS